MAPVRGFEPRYAVLETAVLPLNDTDMEVTAGIEPALSGFAVRCIADLPGHRKWRGRRATIPQLSAGGALFCQLNYALMEWITGQDTILQPAGSEPAALPVELPVNNLDHLPGVEPGRSRLQRPVPYRLGDR